MSVARALGRRVAVAAACALLAPTVAHAHTPGAVLRGFGTPNVDGLLGPGEWAGAATKDLEVSRPGGGAVPATVFVMNDGTSLYLGFRISHPVLDPAEGLYFAFDNDHDGLTETGDDLLFLGGPATGAGPRDMVIDFAAGLLPDVEVGGTSDIRGAV